MQRPDEEKRRTILRVAREQFTRKPFHEVRLDDIAAAAKVGKGTLYVYFQNKDTLYLDLVNEALDGLLAELEQIADEQAKAEGSGDGDRDGDGWTAIEQIVQRVTRWTAKHPAVFDIVRSGVHRAGADEMRQRRRRMGALIARVLRHAAERGVIDDPSPETTAQFIPAMARSAVVHGNGKHALKPDELSEKILAVLARGIRKGSR